MSKYGEMLGIFELKVGDKILELHPKKGDNRKFRTILIESRKSGDQNKFMDEFDKFMYNIIARDYSPVNDSEKEELEIMIEFNEDYLLSEIMIAFRWTTRDEITKKKEESQKKTLNLPNSRELNNFAVN